ncbi:unnamed protein product [Penicillium salamii]|nr:unnamed protein product [Penicillium salamii]CAG8148055.1 unnamed protein product [Penicillium salamii]CAG8234104.1 unnamed protein product [Penicillium salamii]CAG8280535.1 unnamed protein product [Penicillium salamii]CAG8353021.1 unnamed protein product [Penicillium salamii]
MPNIVGVCIARGLTGVGGGFMVPNAIALIGINLPPGKSRNIAVGLFGAMAPIGAAGGSVFGGIFVQLTPWKWLFFFLAILGAVDFGIVALVVDSEERQSNLNESMDWVGAYLGVTGLILFNFVWNQAPSVGWQNPYEYALLIVALAHLVAFIAWEGKFAKYPLLPLNIWTAPSFGVLMIVALFAFMAFGALIWYLTLWFLTIRNWSLLLAAAGVTPLTVLGAVAAVLSSWLVPRLASQYILAIGALCIIVSTTLVATMPAQQSYWPQAFPAAILMAFCPDFIFTAAQIVASNSVGKDKQGIAGSLIGTIMTYGMSIGLGFAGTVEKYTMLHNTDTVQGYRNALYLAIGMGVAALVLDLLFVRVAAEIKEGWDDEQTSEF